MLPQDASQKDTPQKGSNFEGVSAKKKYTRKKKDESLGAVCSTSHSDNRDSKVACTIDNVVLKREFHDVVQEQQLELVGKSCEVALGNKKQGITHNQMKDQNIAGNCIIDRITCDFSDEKYIVFRRKRKKCSSEKNESHSSRKEQKQDIESDMVCDKIESQDHNASLEQNTPQRLDCKCIQNSDQKLIKKVQSSLHPHDFTTDLEQKGKMGLECNSGKIAAEIQDGCDIDVAFSSHTGRFEEKTLLDNHNSFCEICKAGGELLCCDGKDCLFTYHLSCLDPPLDQVPSGNWFCPACLDKRTCSDLLSAPPVVESIWDMKEFGITKDTPCDFMSTRAASIQKQGKEQEYLQTKRTSEAEHDFSMPTARNNGISDATEIPKKILAEASRAYQTVDFDGLRKYSEEEFENEKLYYVKYKGLSHAHNRWITESQIMKEAPKQLSSFNKKIQQGTALQWNPQWTEPHRLLRKRVLMPSKHSLNGCDVLKGKVEWLVKWRGLEYDQCTWELEDLDVLCSTSATKLMKEYEKRSKEAQKRASSKREIKEKNSQDIVYAKLKEIPKWIKGADKLSHQMKYISKLHKFWQSHKNAVIIDEVNQERILTTIIFLLLLIKEFEVARPILVVLPSTTISSWEDEFLRCNSFVNFVVYNGNRNSREVIRKQEFYDESGCVMVQIVLTTCDIAIADLEHLKQLEWEALIVDEFQRINLSKSLCHLEQILVDFRLVLFSEAPKDNSSDMSHLLSFLKMEKKGQIVDILRQGEDQEVKGGASKVKKSVEKYIIYEHRSDNLSGVKLIEHWVPVKLTNFQMEQYCNTLIRSSDLLCLPSRKNDSVERLRDLLLSLRKCCNHPYLLDPSLEISLTKKFPERECYDVGINASGKLQLLDNVLSKIKLNSKRLLILFQTPGQSSCASIGDILDDHLRNRLGAGSYERVDGGLAPAKKQAALQRFNCKNSGRLVFLLEKRACGPNIKLSSIDIVIIFDSDWIPLNDLRALQRTHIDTQVEHLKVFRFYSPYTVEERSLIVAKLDIEFDTNLENFNATICQQMLRWGVAHLFENYDKFHSSGGPLLGSQFLYSDANLQMLVDGMSGDALCSSSLDDTLWVSLFPRVSRKNGYGKGIILFGESKDQLEAERKIPSNVFWTNVLNTRQVDPEYSSRQQKRLKKKVHYSERSLSKSEIEIAGTESKTKRRRVGDTLDPLSISSWIKDAKKAISVRKARDEGAIDRSVEDQLSQESTECENSNVKDKSIFTVPQQEKSHSQSPGSFDACNELSGPDVEIVSETSCSQPICFSHDNSLCTSKQSFKIESPSHYRVLERPYTSSIEGSVHQNNESGDGCMLVSPHQNIHLRTKQEILRLCNALKFPDEVTKMAEQFHSHVMRKFHYPIKKIALAQAVEISLCLAAANCLKHAVDIESSLESAKSQLHFECSRQEVDLVYEKLCQKFPTLKKIRIPATVGHPCNQNIFLSANSINQKHTEGKCLKDGKMSNDGRPTQLIQSRTAHPVVASYNSTGLDGHQIERVEVNCTLGTTSQRDYLGQPSIRNPVQEERNLHPERLISITRKRVDVPNQHSIADSERDPQHIMESQDQNDLAIKHTSLMADKMCAERQEFINACVLKQQSGQTELDEGSGRNKRKNKTMDNSRIAFISNTEKSVKLIEKERNSAEIDNEPSQHLSSGSELLRVRQTSIGEEANRRYSSIVNATTAKTTLSHPSSRVNSEQYADKILSQSCARVNFELTTADTVSQLTSGVTLELPTDISHTSSGELPQISVNGPCQISSELHIDQCSQGGEPSFLKEGQPKHSSSSQHCLPITSIVFRGQSQQSCDFSSFANNLQSIQDIQCNYMNMSETQNQTHHLHHTSGVGQVAMPTTPSEPNQSTIIESGSTIAVTTEPSTASLTLNLSPSAPFVYNSRQIWATASSRLQPNLTDPLLHEMGRLKKENERIKKLHEEESAQIKAQFQQEFEDLKKKYDTLLEEKQLSFEQKTKNIDEILVKVSLNQRLGEMIRGNTRRENDSMVSGSATQQEQSHHLATHGYGERISQLPNSAIHTDVSANVPESFTAARSVQASRMLASQGLTNRILEGRVGTNANSSCFGSTVSTSIPVFQTPADSIVHVLASPTSIADITTNNGNQVPISNFSLFSSQNVTGFQPGFKLNLDVNSIVANGDMHLGIREKSSKHPRTCLPESSSRDFMREKSIHALKNIEGQIEQHQPETVPTSQTNCISNSSEFASVIYLSDDD